MMKLKIKWGSWLCLFAAMGANGGAFAEAEPEWNLMLVGGSMNTCSSMSPSRCSSTDWIDQNTMRVGNYMQFSAAQINAVLAENVWLDSPELQRQTGRVLGAMHRRFADEALSFADFRRHFSDVYPNLWGALNAQQWSAVVDHMQQPLASGISERSNLALSIEPAGADLFKQFANRAQAVAAEQPARVLVITASGRDSFDAIDFYLDSFNQLGVEAQWLPIDAAFAHAVAHDDCANISHYRAEIQGSFGRERVYPQWAEKQAKFCEKPEKIVELLESAHGVFINGGDQSLTRQAFVQADNQPQPWLAVLQQRVANGEMIAGGTSAGTAVMTALPMISNGTSAQGLIEGAVAMPLPPPVNCVAEGTCAPAKNADSLSYHPAGGLGLFPYGLLDTHFSERGRQGRLLQLQADTAAPLAVGVDETTALLVDTRTGEFKVQGAHGVFMLSHVSHDEQSVTSRFTYLRHGSGGTFSHDSDVFAGLHFSSSAQGDRGMQRSENFLRDRTLTSALAACGENPVLFQGRQGNIRVLLAYDEQSHIAHANDGCEVALGVLHFVQD